MLAMVRLSAAILGLAVTQAASAAAGIAGDVVAQIPRAAVDPNTSHATAGPASLKERTFSWGGWGGSGR